MLMCTNVSWPQIKVLLLAGEKATYCERDGWFSVLVPAASMECEFPDAQTFDLLPMEARGVYDRDWAEEFVSKFKAKLLRSSHSTEDAGPILAE